MIGNIRKNSLFVFGKDSQGYFALIRNSKWYAANLKNLNDWQESSGCKFSIIRGIIEFDSEDDYVLFKLAWG